MMNSDCFKLATWFPTSVTRFGKISPLCLSVKSLWQFSMLNLVVGKRLNQFGNFRMLLGKFSCAVNGQIWKNNWAIWSHCFQQPIMFLFYLTSKCHFPRLESSAAGRSHFDVFPEIFRGHVVDSAGVRPRDNEPRLWQFEVAWILLRGSML